MQVDVVKPLLHEIRVKDMLTKRLQIQQSKNSQDLKQLYSIVKVPRLCDEFHKAVRRRQSKSMSHRQADEFKTMDYMKSEIQSFPSEQAFFDNFV